MALLSERMLASAGNGTETHDESGHGGHAHVHAALLFPFIAMLIGISVTHLGSRFPLVASLPYTVTLLIIGLLLGYLHLASYRGLGTLSDSIDMWMAIDPHLLLYAFLPVLLFGDAVGIVWHDFRRTALQCLILAGPGVVIGTAGMTAVAEYILPYDWTFYECATFASVLAATDPVAVVGLMKEMGASKVLTMQIAGESLLNDGVALVVWLIFFDFMNGKEQQPGDIILGFLRLAVGGLIFGVAVGLITSRWMSLASNRLVHTDSLVQMSLTITCAYISFFVGENELGFSGVLASIFAALMVSKYATPLLCDAHATHAVWHLLEYFGNTVLFILCGIFSYDAYSKVEWVDCGWLFVIYTFSTLVRGLMILCLSPFVNLAGGGEVTKTTWKECLVMTWGGLRGAVGLALALSMRNSLFAMGKQRTGDLMIFFVSGFAGLTLLINATTIGILLRKLQLTTPSSCQVVLLSSLRRVLTGVAEKAYKDATENDLRFCSVQQEELKHMLDHLKEENDHGEEVSSGPREHGLRHSKTGLVDVIRRSQHGLASFVSFDSTEVSTEPSAKADLEQVVPIGARAEQTDPEAKTHERSKSNLGETGSTVESITSGAKGDKKKAHWWWGFEPIDPASGTYSRQGSLLAGQDSEKRFGMVAVGTQQERLVYRKLLLSMLRAEYAQLMDKGMLPTRSEGAALLIASVDAADDFVGLGLSDWQILHKSMFSRRSGIVTKVREVLSPYYMVAPVHIKSGLSFDLFTIVSFIDAHHTVCHRLLESDCFMADAREAVLAESCAELDAAHHLLQSNGIGEFHISKLRTVQLATMLFEVQKEQVQRWKDTGIVSDKEMEELLHVIKHGVDHTTDTVTGVIQSMSSQVRNQFRRSTKTFWPVASGDTE